MGTRGLMGREGVTGGKGVGGGTGGKGWRVDDWIKVGNECEGVVWGREG